MKRCFDLSIAFISVILFFIPLIAISLAIKKTSTGPIIYWSKRMGKDNVIFLMPKFRTMELDTPEVATHLLENSVTHLTPIGAFLRKFSLDELPQVYSVFKGDMTITGPRPALFNQHDLIKLRDKNAVSYLKPGITGWAQVNGRDELSIEEKVKFDVEYLSRKSIKFDLYIIYLTLLKVIKKDGISH
jgi:O-antigen biosynthesis protein WbqP